MMWLFPDVFPGKVVSFVTRAYCDFRVHDGNFYFNQRQKEVLESGFGGRLFPTVRLRQQHEHQVHEVADKTPRIMDGDGLMTRKKAVPLAVRTADCLPVFLYDPVRQGIALLHAGWKPTEKRIVDVAIKQMVDKWKTDPKDIIAALGPAIHSCCYEVGAEFKEIFPDDVRERNKKLYFDLPQANVRQLLAMGVPQKQIWTQAPCTCCDDQFFSHRREGDDAGRMLCGMMLLP